MGNVFEAILRSPEIYSNSYDIKVFIIGMSQIMIENSLDPSMTNKLPQILDYIVTLLNKQKVIETKQINSNNNDDDDSDDDMSGKR